MLPRTRSSFSPAASNCALALSIACSRPRARRTFAHRIDHRFDLLEIGGRLELALEQVRLVGRGLGQTFCQRRLELVERGSDFGRVARLLDQRHQRFSRETFGVIAGRLGQGDARSGGPGPGRASIPRSLAGLGERVQHGQGKGARTDVARTTFQSEGVALLSALVGRGLPHGANERVVDHGFQEVGIGEQIAQRKFEVATAPLEPGRQQFDDARANHAQHEVQEQQPNRHLEDGRPE